jgi:YbbR domain-containing protein
VPVVVKNKPQKLFFKHILRKIFLEDWALKLIALVITFGLWFIVTGLSTPTTRRITVPLNLNVSSSAMITNQPLEMVDIEITGDKRKVEQLNKGELGASIDLTDVQPGERIIPLTPDTVYVPLPQGIKLTEVQPSRIAVKLELVQEKDVEVKADVSGAPAQGFEVYQTTVVPQKIRVRGPASIVSTLSYVQTERIDLTDRREDLAAKQVAVTSPDPKAAVLNTFVDVNFRIGEKRLERMFSIAVAGMPETIATFGLYGPRSVLAGAKKDSLYVEMNGDQPRVVLPAEWTDTVEVRDLTVKTGKANP